MTEEQKVFSMAKESMVGIGRALIATCGYVTDVYNLRIVCDGLYGYYGQGAYYRSNTKRFEKEKRLAICRTPLVKASSVQAIMPISKTTKSTIEPKIFKSWKGKR